jgi:hypothetical protein
MHLKESPASATHYQSPQGASAPTVQRKNRSITQLSTEEKSFNLKNFNRRKKNSQDAIAKGFNPCLFMPVFRIRTQSGRWIRIRIQEDKNYPQKKEKIKKFNVLDVLF